MKRLILVAGLFVSISMTLATSSVHAQQSATTKNVAAFTDDKDSKDSKVQQIAVRGSLDAYDPRHDDTASKIVVNHDEIVKYGDTNVLDVLKRVPGVTVSSNGGRGSEVQMRGLGGGYTQVLINSEKAPPGFTLDSLSPDVIERIEVLRAASAEFSTQAIAGTINIVLKKTVKAGRRELKLGYSHAHDTNGPNASLQFDDTAGALSWSIPVNVVRERFARAVQNVEEHADPVGSQDGRRLGKLPQDGRVTRLNLSPRLIWSLDNGDKVVSQTFFTMGHFQNAVHTLITTELGPPPDYPNLEQTMSNDNNLLREEVNWTHKYASGTKLDTKLSVTSGSASNMIYRMMDGSPGVGTLHELVRSDNNVRGFNTMGKVTNASWEGHALALGWDGGYMKSHDARLVRDAYQPDVSLPGGDEFYTSDIARLAVYIQDEWNVTPQWSVYIGARWEGIQTRVEGNTFADSDNRSSVFSPMLQTLYKLPNTTGDQLRFALNRTYRAPTVQSLIPHRFTSANNSQTNPDSIGNPDLRPELAFGIESSWEHYWGEGALVSVSASARNIDNSTRNQTVFDGGRWVSLPMNTGRARTHGLELEAKFPLKVLTATTTALDLRSSLSRNWSRVDAIPGPNNRLLNQTPLSVTLGADYKLDAVTTGGSFVFKQGGEVRVSDAQVTYESARRDLDLYVLWKLTPLTQLRVAGSNLLGQDYIYESSYTVASSGTQRSRTIYPGCPMFRATLEMKF
ncbi:TonB-dependent receptor [Duganella sp. BJB1802]|uniref:TonB-dependent receptor plug domain-containing protein n=1 Tax=Duganella sp. BJB1802 TaxID=2744575 RepID=UPI0015936B66|nr:TonB-dependent receptor [Duganella sp. BJB1802]NVD69518.1 TonB-dependent receptor [Duganella sp. BJB1802]